MSAAGAGREGDASYSLGPGRPRQRQGNHQLLYTTQLGSTQPLSEPKGYPSSLAICPLSYAILVSTQVHDKQLRLQLRIIRRYS